MAIVKPPPVASGETVEAQWGIDMVDLIESKGYFVRTPDQGWQLDNVAAPSGNVLLELTHIPANDPDIFAVEVQFMIRHSSGTNSTMSVKHYTTDLPNAVPAALKYNSGSNIGGMAGSARVYVGGVNNRQIVWSAGGTGHWLRVLGYWKRANLIKPIQGDPIVAGWGAALQDGAAAAWEYHHAGVYATVLAGVDGNTTTQSVVIPSIPANDPDIVAVNCAIQLKDNSGAANLTALLRDYDGTLAGSTYTSGVEARGGLVSPLIAFVGGAANNEVKWSTSEAGAGVDFTLWVLGYWKRQVAASPALPPKPAESAVISSAWGNAIADIAGRKVRFVPTPMLTILNGVDGVASPGAVVEIPDPFPKNDPTVVAAAVSVMIRDSNGAQNLTVYALHFDGSTAGFSFSDGTQDRGGGAMGPFYTEVGGTNGRQIKWQSSTDSPDLIDVWAYCFGWYVEETA